MTDLNKKVRDWLDKSGYPLEMEIAKTLQKAGFGVVQSEYFEDFESGKFRETDVVAYEENRGKTCRSIFSLVVECKGGKDKPWVLFTNKNYYLDGLSVTRRATNEIGESILSSLALNKEIASLPLFVLPERTAYGLTAALRDSKSDITFEALNAVCKATIGLIARWDDVKGENIIPFVWPVILINAPLFEAFLDDKNDFQVKEIEKGTLIWRNPIITRHTLIQIYTKERFLQEASEINENAKILLKYVNQENDNSPRKKKVG